MLGSPVQLRPCPPHEALIDRQLRRCSEGRDSGRRRRCPPTDAVSRHDGTGADASCMIRVATPAVLLAIAATTGVCCFGPVFLGPAHIDGSSDDTFTASLDAVRKDLPPGQDDKFDAAMAAHGEAALMPDGDDGNPHVFLMALSEDKGAPARRLRGRLDGLTARQIINTAPGFLQGMPFLGLQCMGDLAGFRANANESAAIAALKNICSAQAQCQASGVIDANGNGTGEYGFFGELAGTIPVRGTSSLITPPILYSTFGKVDQDGLVTQAGYHFRMYLPDAAGRGVGDPRFVDPKRSEVLWCCY